MNIDDKCFTIIIFALVIVVASAFLNDVRLRSIIQFYVPIVSIILIGFIAFIDGGKMNLKRLGGDKL
jgi:hypothetical protein